MTPVTTTHRDIILTHNENNGEWTCDLFTKPAETLALAIERINKKLDTEEKTPFKRFKAFYKSSYLNPWRLVEVTSVTDDGKSAWISHGGKRVKIGSNYSSFKVFSDTPENAEIMRQIQELELEVKKANQKITETEGKLIQWKP